MPVLDSKGVHLDVDDVPLRDVSTQEIAAFYTEVSHHTGSVVEIREEQSCLPLVRDSDGQPVLLYEFVSELDGLTDYDDLQERFPTLSYGQIAGCMAFLRRLTEFNTKGIDLETLEDSDLESNTDFQEALRRALSDGEVTRVLTSKQRHGG